MEDLIKFTFGKEPLTKRTVYKKGNGPGVILMHELPGMIPECVDLARRLADANFTVYLPQAFWKTLPTPFHPQNAPIYGAIMYQ
ncbi:MAG: hypothetical protein QNJ54_37900 [Prochloraceae cyanobacterium]|nr:hypothetical protein [Prochloraceae cyanobacterium]